MYAGQNRQRISQMVIGMRPTILRINTAPKERKNVIPKMFTVGFNSSLTFRGDLGGVLGRVEVILSFRFPNIRLSIAAFNLSDILGVV